MFCLFIYLFQWYISSLVSTNSHKYAEIVFPTFDNMFTRGVRSMKLTRHPARPNLNVCRTFSVTSPCFMPNKMKAISECVKILIQINFYFLLKIWQMRSVSAQNREKNFFHFFFNFSQTITQSFITRFMCKPNVVQDGECVNPVKVIKRKIRVLK